MDNDREERWLQEQRQKEQDTIRLDGEIAQAMAEAEKDRQRQQEELKNSINQLRGDTTLNQPSFIGSMAASRGASQVNVALPASRSRSSQGTAATVPLPPKNNKVLLYDGSTPLRDYLKTFERIAVINNWSEAQKCDALATHLTGPAQQVYTDAPEEVGYSYELLVAELQAVFEPTGQAEYFQAQLMTRRRKTEEGWPQLGQAVKRLVRQAYPEADQRTQDRLAREAFIDAIDDKELRSRVRDKEPETLHRAVQAAVRSEAYQKVDQAKEERTKHKRSVRQVTFQGNTKEETNIREVMEEMKQAVNQLSQTDRDTGDSDVVIDEQKPTGSDVDRSTLRHCYNCGKPGHLFSECPDVICYSCGKKGHVTTNCSEAKKKRPSGWSPGPRRDDRNRSYSPRGDRRSTSYSPNRQWDRQNSPGRDNRGRDRDRGDYRGSGGFRNQPYNQGRRDSRDRYDNRERRDSRDRSGDRRGTSPYRNPKRSPSPQNRENGNRNRTSEAGTNSSKPLN